MEFQNLIEKRRSVRKYVERNTVTKDEILSMIKAAQEAPSWKNSQTGRYYCIMDEKNVEQFRRECLPEMRSCQCPHQRGVRRAAGGDAAPRTLHGWEADGQGRFRNDLPRL